MADITMCPGGDCAKRDQCRRFTATPTPNVQSYFGEPPIRPDGSCTFYWPTNAAVMIRKAAK